VSPSFQEYFQQVERFFVVVRMSGFLLSPKDMEKVRQYYLKGVPLHLVLQGIAEGLKSFQHHAAPQQRVPHSLTFYSHFISPRIRRWNKGTEPTVPPPEQDPSGVLRALHHLRAEAAILVESESRPLERKAKEMLQAGLDALVEETQGLDTEGFVERLRSLDASVLAFYDAGLDPSVRHELSHATEQELGADRGLGFRAIEGRRKVVYLRRLRDSLGVPVLYE